MDDFVGDYLSRALRHYVLSSGAISMIIIIENGKR